MNPIAAIKAQATAGGQLVTFYFHDPVIRFSFVGIFIVLSIYVIEAFLIAPLRRDIRAFGKDILRETIKNYLSVAWFGWICMSLGAVLIEMSVLDLPFFFQYKNTAAKILIAVLLIVGGILFNLRSYCKQFTLTLRRKMK